MDKDNEGGVVFSTMNNDSKRKIRKLNYTIHNPNSVEETAKVLLGVFVDANTSKVERNLRELVDGKRQNEVEQEKDNGVGVM